MAALSVEAQRIEQLKAAEIVPPEPDHRRCFLCGNSPRQLFPVLAYRFQMVCERCSGVLVDRRRNCAFGPWLVRSANAAIWR